MENVNIKLLIRTKLIVTKPLLFHIYCTILHFNKYESPFLVLVSSATLIFFGKDNVCILWIAFFEVCLTYTSLIRAYSA